MILNYINSYVENFLENNNFTEAIPLWKTENNQDILLKYCKKHKIKLKDPTKPKRGKSAFLYYCDHNRSKLRNKFPELTIKQIVSKLGSSWQELKTQGKINEYEEMSVDDRNRYRSEMKNYYPQKIKKGDSSFNKFVSLKYDKILLKYPGYNSKQIKKHLKEKWNKLPLEKKEKYN